MPTVEQLTDTITKLEKLFRKNGLWRRPEVRPPVVPIRGSWDETTQEAAKLINRVFHVRCLPACARMFGGVNESAVFAFIHDNKSEREKLDYIKRQVNQLISDVGMLPNMDTSGIFKIEE